MKVNLPQHASYDRVRLFVQTPHWQQQMTYSSPHAVAEINLPDGVEEDEVVVIARHLDGGSRLVGDEIVLREATAPPQRVFMPQPFEMVTKDEEAPAEPCEEDAPELVEGTPEQVQEVVEDAPEPPAEPAQEEMKKPRRKRRPK